MEDAESTEQDKDNINKDKTKEETVMDTSELYQISDGDTGKQVADGLKQNFDIIGAAIPDDNTILEKSGYRVDMAALMGDSPASATISDAIGGWDNLVAAINAKMVIIGYKEGAFTTALHAEIMESTKIIIAVHSENVAMKFSIVNSGGTLSLTRTNTKLTPAYELKGLYNAISMNQMHLDDATPYIGSFEDFKAAIETKAYILDCFKEEGNVLLTTPIMAQAISSNSIQLQYVLGLAAVIVTITKTSDGASADCDMAVSCSPVKVTLSSAYTIPANPSDTEYIYYITVGTTTYPVTGAEGIKWQDGTPPEVEANTTLVVSVINNLAVWGTFKEEA